MMDWIRSWLIGITAAALVVALVDNLLPVGAVKKIAKLACGLLLLISMLKPIFGIDDHLLAVVLTEYRMEAQGSAEALELENKRLVKMIIEEETGAYIQDKAAEIGIICSAEVSCAVLDNGMPYPQSVVIIGELTEKERQSISRIIEGELAVSAENQHYERRTGNEQ